MNYKLVNFEDTIDNEKIIKCGKLNNDIIFMKYDVSLGDVIIASENEFVILVNKGQVYDYKENEGNYLVKEIDLEIEEQWKDLFIRDAENNGLCVIFFNKNIIKNNKLLINKEVEKEKTFNNKLIKYNINIYVEYDFRIENPRNFLDRIIGLRKVYTKQEIIEKVRKYILNSIEKRINTELEEYKLDIEKLSNNTKMIDNFNEYDSKLLEYGVKLISYKIVRYEIIDKKNKFF